MKPQLELIPTGSFLFMLKTLTRNAIILATITNQINVSSTKF